MININKTIQLTTKRSHQIIAFEGDSITNEIIKKGEYDSNTLAFIHDVLSIIKPKVSLDIGANIGNHSLIIAGISERVISFEPIAFLFEVLQQNLKINHFENATPVNVGLSTVDSEAEIFVDHNGNLGSSSLTERHGDGELLSINLKNGDTLLAQMAITEGIDFIKIDVEGHEAEALLGLEKTIRLNQPLILLEWKTDVAINAFKVNGLFQNLFKNYNFYSLSNSSSKKVHSKNFSGLIKRFLYKYLNQNWCLSSFHKNKHYSNICFVPSKYQTLFSQLPYLSQD